MKPKQLPADLVLEMFKGIKDKLDNQDEKLDGQDKKLDEIHTQTAKTNGRVSALEDWRNQWKGGLTVFSMILLPVILYGVYFYINHH